jgi:hypothetical protein
MNDSIDKEDLKCPVCRSCYYLPVTLTCNHSVCEPCFKGLIDNGVDRCPICRGQLAILNSPVMCPKSDSHPFTITCLKHHPTHNVRKSIINRDLCRKAGSLFPDEIKTRRDELEMMTERIDYKIVEDLIKEIDRLFIEVNNFFRDFRNVYGMPLLNSKTEEAVNRRSSKYTCNVSMLFGDTDTDLIQECAYVDNRTSKMKKIDGYLLHRVLALICHERRLHKTCRPGWGRFIVDSLNTKIDEINRYLLSFTKMVIDKERLRAARVHVTTIQRSRSGTPVVQIVLRPSPLRLTNSRRLISDSGVLLIPLRTTLAYRPPVEQVIIVELVAAPAFQPMATSILSRRNRALPVVPTTQSGPTFYYNRTERVQETDPSPSGNPTVVRTSCSTAPQHSTSTYRLNTTIRVQGTDPLEGNLMDQVSLLTLLQEEQERVQLTLTTPELNVQAGTSQELETADLITFENSLPLIAPEVHVQAGASQILGTTTQTVTPQLNEVPTPIAKQEAEQPRNWTKLYAFIDRIRQMYL